MSFNGSLANCFALMSHTASPTILGGNPNQCNRTSLNSRKKRPVCRFSKWDSIVAQRDAVTVTSFLFSILMSVLHTKIVYSNDKPGVNCGTARCCFQPSPSLFTFPHNFLYTSFLSPTLHIWYFNVTPEDDDQLTISSNNYVQNQDRKVLWWAL